MKKRAVVLPAILSLGLLPVILCSYNRTETRLSSTLCGRQFNQWKEQVMISERNTITVYHRHSHDLYISFGHIGGIGPGDDHFSVAEFYLPPTKYRWAIARDERPIVLRIGQKQPWLVTLDRTDMGNILFRFYKFLKDGHAIEVIAKDFPRNLAIQNMWLREENGFRDGKPINEYEVVAALDTTSIDFQNSLTAKMWLCIEKGSQYSNGQNVGSGFLREYLAKYIKEETNSQQGAEGDAVNHVP